MKMTILKTILIIAVLAYLAFAAALFLAQTSIFFPARLVPPAGPLPPGAERLELKAPDGVRLEGVYIPPVGGNSRTLLLGFAGNASNAQGIAEFLHRLYPAHAVIAFHYRGYKPSGGMPAAAALLDDAPLLYDLARERLQPERVIAVGISIGSGVAAGLASRRRLDGLILVTPFDSLKATAHGHYPWLPVPWLLRHDLPSADFLRSNPVPVAIVAAEHDRIVPAARTDALRETVSNLVFDRTIAGAQHNDIAYRPEFEEAMRQSLEQVLAASRTR